MKTEDSFIAERIGPATIRLRTRQHLRLCFDFFFSHKHYHETMMITTSLMDLEASSALTGWTNGLILPDTCVGTGWLPASSIKLFYHRLFICIISSAGFFGNPMGLAIIAPILMRGEVCACGASHFNNNYPYHLNICPYTVPGSTRVPTNSLLPRGRKTNKLLFPGYPALKPGEVWAYIPCWTPVCSCRLSLV